jgi:hypothetical protein
MRTSVFKVATKLSAMALCPGHSRSFPSRRNDTDIFEALAERDRGVLGAAIGMMHESCGWLAPPYCHLEGVDHEFSVFM